MKLEMSEVLRSERWPNDKLAYDYAELRHPTFGVVGTVHTNGYAPRWAFNLTKLRNKYLLTPLADSLHDGAAWDSAELATAEAEKRIERFLQKKEELGL